MRVPCEICGAIFSKPPSRKAGRFCSIECMRVAAPTRKHGLTGTPVNYIWREMRKRCRNPKNKDYPHYGARGIKVCERWNDFENFLADMGPRPGDDYTIDRRNNDGNYEPSNCYWATRTEQSRNRRGVYTAEEDQRIRDAVARGLNFTQVAAVVGKPRGSVTARAYRIGLKSGQPVKSATSSSVLASPERKP